MALRTVASAPGRPALRAVAAAVRAAQQGDGLRAVQVVVRAEDSAVLVRRALARELGGLAAVEVLPFDRLTRTVLAQAGADRTPAAPRPALAAALRRAAFRAGGPLAASADQQATQDALVASYHELTGLGETGLGVARARGGFGGHVADVVVAARERLAAHGWSDDAALLTRAGAVAAAATLTPIVVLRAEAPTPVERAALQALAEHRDVVVVDTGDTAPEPPGHLRVRAVTDPDEEVRDALRTVEAALADGVPAERIALAWTSETYRRIAAEQLHRSDLAWHGPDAGTLLETAAGRAALDAVHHHLADTTERPRPTTWRALAEAIAADVDAAAPDDIRTDAVRRVVHQLGALDALGGDLPPAAVVATTLRAELAAVLPRHGTVGRGVTVGSLRRVADGAPWTVVHVVGLAEGLAPAGPGGASLLTDTDRSALGLPTTTDQQARQHQRLRTAIAQADHATLSWPRADLRRTMRRSRSRWVDELATAGLVHTDEDAPSSWAAVARPTVPITALDHRLRAAMAEPDALAGHDERFALGHRALMARHTGALSVYDGDVSGEDLSHLRLGERPVTATQLESVARCGRTYFTRYVLGVREQRVDDELAGPDNGTTGTFAHRVMERVLGREHALGRPLTRAEVAHEFDRAVSSLPDLAAQLARMPTLLRENHDRSWLARVWQAVELDVDHRTATGRVPIAQELEVGVDRPAVVTLPSGRTLPVRGLIDRVDRRPDGALALVDYKTGSHRPVRKDNLLEAGTRLQLALYAVAAEQHLGAPVATVEYRYVRADRHKVDELSAPDHVAALGPVLEHLVDIVEHGLFVPGAHPTGMPGRPSCFVCDPHGLLTRLYARRRRALVAAGIIATGADDDA